VAVAAQISGLSPNTTYHFQAVATNTSGTKSGADATFKTLPNPPTVSTGAATGVTQTAGTLNGTVNPNGGLVSDCRFEYGTSTSYGFSFECSPPPGSGNAAVPVGAQLNGLTASTTYHYRVAAINAGGATAGLDQTFSTPAEPPPAPPPLPTGPGTPVQETRSFTNGSPPEGIHVTLSRTSLSASRSGSVGVPMRCLGSLGACRVGLMLRTVPGRTSLNHGAIRHTSAALNLASGTFSVLPGAMRTVNLRLTAVGRRLLGRLHTARAALTLVLQRADGTSETTSVAVVLRLTR
jgi:hypothetical protein